MINEIELKELEKKLNEVSYGALKNEFTNLGIQIKKKQHEKKSDLIKRALAKYVEKQLALAQKLEEDGGDNKDCAKNGGETIYCDDPKHKRQNLPNPDQNHLTENPYGKNQFLETVSENQIVKTTSEQPISENQISETVSENQIEDSVLEDVSKQLASKQLIPEQPIINKAISKIQNIKSEIAQKQNKNQYNGLSKEVIEKNIKNIKANLKDALPEVRATLLKKMEELEKLL